MAGRENGRQAGNGVGPLRAGGHHADMLRGTIAQPCSRHAAGPGGGAGGHPGQQLPGVERKCLYEEECFQGATAGGIIGLLQARSKCLTSACLVLSPVVSPFTTVQVAEGVSTAAAVVGLGRKYRVALPVLTAVAQVLDGNLSPKEVVYEIMNLPQIDEK